MIIHVYIMLVLLGFLFLYLGLQNGAYGKTVREDDKAANVSKLGITVIYLLLSGVLFALLALNSLAVETVHCDTQILQTSTSGNLTTYTNDYTCVVQRHPDESLAALFGGLVIFNVIMLFIYVGERAWP